MSDHVPARRGHQVAGFGLVAQHAPVVQRVDVEPAAKGECQEIARRINILYVNIHTAREEHFAYI